MFARKFRLPSSIIFSERAIPTEYYLIKKRSNNLGFNRYGFTISKKVDKRATVRNRTKRILRSCFEDLAGSIVVGNDILVIIKKQAVGVSKSDLLSAVKKDLEKLKLL